MTRAQEVASPAVVEADAGIAGELPVDEQSERQLLSDLGNNDFRLHRTAHFVIASDAADSELEPLLPQLEATYQRVLRFCELSDVEVRLPERRLQGVFFNRYSDFCAYAEKLGYGCQNLTGFFFSQNNRMVFYNLVEDPSLADAREEIEQIQRRIERRSKDEASKQQFEDLLAQDAAALKRLLNRRDSQVDRLNRLTIQHELAHQVLYNVGVHVIGARNPGWLVEGLACLFETQQAEKGGKVFSLNTWRRDDLRTALRSEDSKARGIQQDFADAVQRGTLIPLRQLIGDAKLFGRREEAHLIHRYAQAWSFVYFLQQRRPREFAAYLQSISRREVGVETDEAQELRDYESALGPLDDKLEKQWLAFVHTLIK